MTAVMPLVQSDFARQVTTMRDSPTWHILHARYLAGAMAWLRACLERLAADDGTGRDGVRACASDAGTCAPAIAQARQHWELAPPAFERRAA